MPVVLLIAAAAILGGVVAAALGLAGELARAAADCAPVDLGVLSPADVALLRPPTSLWGYNMQVSEDALQAIARALTARDVEIASLRRQLAERDGLGAWAASAYPAAAALSAFTPPSAASPAEPPSPVDPASLANPAIPAGPADPAPPEAAVPSPPPATRSTTASLAQPSLAQPSPAQPSAAQPAPAQPAPVQAPPARAPLAQPPRAPFRGESPPDV